jgi:gamma-butyrobetaine dioxygenase
LTACSDAVTAELVSAEVNGRSNRLSLRWSDGHHSEFASVWLRDNRREDRDARTGQRLRDVADLDLGAALAGTDSDRTGSVTATWADGFAGSFELAWLRAHCTCSDCLHASSRQPRLWAACAPSDHFWTSYADLRTSASERIEWLAALSERGLAFLRDVPIVEGQVLEVAALFGFVRDTNYGRLFDVRAVRDADHLAYTDVGLGLHTDNGYREPLPGIQLLHCLVASETGGMSLFVDGYQVAARLEQLDAVAYRLLTTTPVRFAYRDSETELVADRPLIDLGREGRPTAICYNNRTIQPLRLPVDQVEPFYRAYQMFARLQRSPEFECRVLLRPGDLVAFDNTRILHGRTGYDSGAGNRHLQGCYVDRDGLESTLAVLRRPNCLTS